MLFCVTWKRKLLARRSQSKSLSGINYPDKVTISIGTTTQKSFPFQLEKNQSKFLPDLSMTWNKSIPRRECPRKETSLQESKKGRRSSFSVPYLYGSDNPGESIIITFFWKGEDKEIRISQSEILEQINLGRKGDVHPLLKTSRSYPSLKYRKFTCKIDCIQIIHHDILLRIFLADPVITRGADGKWFISNVTLTNLNDHST